MTFITELSTNETESTIVLGFRLWKERYNDLHAYFHKYLWVPGKNIFTHSMLDIERSSPTPHKEFTRCQCGLYGFTDINELARLIDRPAVIGLVAGWGRVIIGTKGWRAQYAKPIAIFDVDKVHTLDSSTLQQLSERYLVPLVRPHSTSIDDYRNLAGR
jgi:hypothetical protein